MADRGAMHASGTVYDDDSVVAALPRCANEDGTLTTGEYRGRRHAGEPSCVRIVQKHGWNRALELAGLKPGRVHTRHRSDRIPDEELIESLLLAHEQLQVPLTFDRYESFARRPKLPGAVTARVRFGTWNNALERAGLPINHLRPTRTGERTPEEMEHERLVDEALEEIAAVSHEVKEMDAAIEERRRMRNELVYRAANELRGKNGRPTVVELASAMGVRHSYVGRIIKGEAKRSQDGST